MKQITIIWAWAAGIMTAATILEEMEKQNPSISPESLSRQTLWQGGRQKYQIHLFEKNTTPGNKVVISGWGRCNLTTGIEDKKILLSKYTRGADFIKKAFGKFSPRKCREWFESHGVPLKCEKDNRVFPVSDDWYDIVEVFEHIFAKYRNNIVLHYCEGVESISILSSYNDPFQNQVWENNSKNLISEWKSDSFTMLRNDKDTKKYQITTKKWTYESDIVVITTGWNAYSQTGSTGDGYAFARNLGHTITPLGPSLSSFLTREKWTHALSGLAFENARIWDLSWPLLLTHFWLSGPLAFMTSSQLAWEIIGSIPPWEGLRVRTFSGEWCKAGIKGGSVSKTIYFSPIATMGYIEWEIFLKSEFAKHPKKLLVNILSDLLSRRFVEGFIAEFFPNIADTFPVSISKVDRENISKLLGNGIVITLIERRPWDEFVTAGGVNTDEIDGETMESRIQKNLYFAGEVLNVDGFTGWFSLQICWASGYVVGKDISKKLA